METTARSSQLDDDDFDWEAAVLEMDYTCQSTILSNSNAGGIIAIPYSPTGASASVAIASGACPRPAPHASRFRQSTLDRFADTFSKQKSNSDHRSESFLEEPVAEACGVRDEPCGARNEATEVSIDLEAAKTWIYPVNVPVRDYQFAIAKTALFSNTLVALPTGLGKTFIAAVVMYNYFRWFPKGKIVFAAPSRPLVMQQIKACHNITGIPQEWTIDMTGQMSPPIRLSFWETKRVFFVTPQVLENDIRTGICLVKQLVCLVIDEAHRATGNSAYCVLVRELMAVPLKLRILALTATPGSKHQKIQNVIDNLCISTLEYRHESDHDVSPYVHNRKLELIVVPMGKDAVEINSLLLQAIQPFVARLSAIGVLFHGDLSMLSPYEVLKLRDKFREAPPHSVPPSKFGDVEVCFSTLVTFYHIRKLLSSHGIRPACEMLQERMTQGSFLKQVSKIEVLWKAKHLMQLSLAHGAPNPKLAKMLEILVDHFKTKDPNDSRVIIFSSFRGSVRDIMNSISSIGNMVKATEFIGQSSGKTLKGQTQKMQQAVLEKFCSGGYNVIVATSIGEEGLDIMEVDLVICFDANVSPLRMIQRMGRTGRKNDGLVVVLACEGCEVKAYSKKQASSKAMRKHMLNGGIKSFDFHPSSRMVPHMCKPQVQYVKMSIEQFIPRGKKVKNKTMDISPFSRNISNEEHNLISKYFHQSKDVILKLSLIAFPTFQACPSQVSRVRHSFKTTSMFIEAMRVLQGLSFSKLKNDGFIKDESSKPFNQLSDSRDNSGQGSAAHCTAYDSGSQLQVSALECKFGLHMHHGVQKPRPHSFLFGEDCVTVNSLGSVLVAKFPVLQHVGPQYSIVISTENCVLSSKGPKFKYTHSASLPVASSKSTMQVEGPKLKASTELKHSDRGSLSNLFIKAIQNEEEHEKHVFQTPGCKLKPKEPEEPATEVNGKMEDILPASSLAISRNAVDDIVLSPRLTHFIEEGIVPESPMLNNRHHAIKDEKWPFSRFSWEDDKDNKCFSRMHMNKLLSDELESQPMAILDTLCKNKSVMHFSTPPNSILISEMSSKETSKNGNEINRVQNTMNYDKIEKNIAYSIHDAIHTPFSNILNQISSEEWKCKSGEASYSIVQAPKYKRLRKHGDVVKKLRAKALEARFELDEKAFGSTMSIQENEPKCSNGEKQKAKVHVSAFIEEEADVSDDVLVSEDERFDEKDDQYSDSFIDDRINPTEGSTEAENGGGDMIAFYRRSLLTQSPVVSTVNYVMASHESLSSETAGSCSQEKWHNPVDTQSVNQRSVRKSVVGPAGLGTAAVSVEASNHSERYSSRLESRKRKLIFQPADVIPEENSQLQHELQSAHVESVALHHQLKLPTTDTYQSCDDDFYQELDLDEVEAQATKLLRCRLESSLEKSETVIHDRSAEINEHASSGLNFMCSPSFDLGI